MSEWFKLDTKKRDSAIVTTLKLRFPEAAERGLNWDESRWSAAWIDIVTGNLVLVEPVGTGPLETGTVSANLWVAATETHVPLTFDRSLGYFGIIDEGKNVPMLNEVLSATTELVIKKLSLPVQ
ncbi:hypothetical protein [Cryobacterium sp. 10I5]|uniref:hypothetical protein n=1 Tax=Cryobacterium sp. 10I5 TaxID=3048581 RepID=UPI002B22CEF7|nr:hypothetical protein [Cryobacterium sp. 10I5]MEB0264367.1 hypothetical protein [Cryobacterium sp. 10I5]